MSVDGKGPDGSVDGVERDAFEALLEHIKASRGFDFTGYKRSSLERRIRKRMSDVKVDTVVEYLDRLEVDTGEFEPLFNTICINVTGFFRDPEAWKRLVEGPLPELIDQAGGDEPIRVWSVGCSSGEEAFTAAIVLAEALGPDALRERVKIYATDVDEEALAIARHGVYGRDRLDEVDPEIVERYFETLPGDQLSFRKDLRRSIIFGRNDLIQDAPISRIDLLLCRNTLMYFSAEAQTRILGRLHFSLRERGLLFLGSREMLISRGELFAPVDQKARVFRKVPRAARERHAFAPSGDPADDGAVTGSAFQLREAAFDHSPLAQIVVDRGGRVTQINEGARSLLNLGANDIGRELSELEVSYRPADLRSAIDQVFEERRPVSLGITRWKPPHTDERHTDIDVQPIISPAGSLLGAGVTFADVTRHVRLESELERSKRELELAYEELQSTVEELETTNEELQSTNEELETTNEELQSTNEELETMNEELQSTNEELATMNDELRRRTDELHRVNAYLEAVLTSYGLAVAVLDGEQRVRMWNGEAEELWGLRSDEVLGQGFLGLDFGLPIEQLGRPIRESVAADGDGDGSGPPVRELTLEAVNRRGRGFSCKVRTMTLRLDGERPQVIVLMGKDDEP